MNSPPRYKNSSTIFAHKLSESQGARLPRIRKRKGRPAMLAVVQIRRARRIWGQLLLLKCSPGIFILIGPLLYALILFSS